MFTHKLQAAQDEAQKTFCPRCDAEMEHVDEPIEDYHDPSDPHGHGQRAGEPFWECPECNYTLIDE